MTYKEVLQAAQGQMGPCRACPVCNGRACGGTIPGPGAKGSGTVAVRNFDAWRNVRLNMDTIHENFEPDTSLTLFGRSFKYPFFAGPVGAMALHYGDKYNDLDYNNILVPACAAAGIAAFTGDGTNHKVMEGAAAAITACGGAGIPTVKPWDNATVARKIALARSSGCFAMAMDIDAAGLPFLQHLDPPAGSKTVEQLKEIALAAGVPFILKGIMTVKGAEKAIEAGAAGIVVSNHGGRVLDDSKPKYINSPETMVYHKSRTLFALNIAKKSKKRRYILCEGYMDVISMHEAGFDTAVCACGTALTPEQAKLLSEYADEVVLSYDSDEAGQKATERSLGILGSTTLKVSVLSYQGAKDPDEFIKKYGRERFEMLLNGTANPTEFQLKKSKAKYDLRSDDGRLSYIRERGVSPTARDVYAGRLADETGVSKQAILSQLNGALQAAARRSYRKEQRDLSKEGIASDIRVPYTSSGESALGAANAARQLAVAMLQDPEQVPYVRARLDMSTVLVPEMQRALEAIFRCVDEHLPLNQTSLQQMLDEAAFQQLAHGQAYNHDIRLQRQDIDMYLDRLRTAKPISEQVKDMSDGQLESYFANLGKKKGARPAETDE